MATRDDIVNYNRDYTLYHWGKQQNVDPIIIDRAEGVYFWDKNGKQIIDFSSQLMNVNIGHGNQRVIQAVVDQMQQVSHVHAGNTATEVRGRLGKKLHEIAPKGLKKTFFTLCGSSSNDVAVLMARFITGKQKILTASKSYHGTLHAPAALGGDPRKKPFQEHLISGVVHIENPDVYRCPWGQKTAEETCKKSIEYLEETIKNHNPDSIAAILLEGESGTSGCYKYPSGYLKEVRRLADTYDILLIIDEVMSGFGRCGNWFAVQNVDVSPDIMVMAKGLTSGYIPLGGVMVSDKIAGYLDDHSFTCGMTYGAHPVACAAALANIQVIEDDRLIDNTREVGAYLDTRLRALMDVHPSIGDVRLTGLLGVIDVVKDRDTREAAAPWDARPEDMEVMSRVFASLREQGLYTFMRWNHIFVAPPLIATKAHIDEGLEKISRALRISDEAFS